MKFRWDLPGLDSLWKKTDPLMFLKLLFLFTVVPVVELALLIYVGNIIGILNTVILVIVTGVAGAGLAKMEGLKTWYKIRESFARGVMPRDEMVEGLMILVAGAVLLTPGLLTDTLGLCILIPPIRSVMRSWITYKIKSRVKYSESEKSDDEINFKS